MLTRAARWFLIGAPAVAGILLLIFGTAGSISVAFGVTLIAIAALVWLSNWFIRMSFDDRGRQIETEARERRAREQRVALARRKRADPPKHPPRTKLGRRPRRPS